MEDITRAHGVAHLAWALVTTQDLSCFPIKGDGHQSIDKGLYTQYVWIPIMVWTTMF